MRHERQKRSESGAREKRGPSGADPASRWVHATKGAGTGALRADIIGPGAWDDWLEWDVLGLLDRGSTGR